MAVPARKNSKSKSKKRYKANSKIIFVPHNICKNCGAAKIPYYLCKICGFYNGKSIISIRKQKQVNR